MHESDATDDLVDRLPDEREIEVTESIWDTEWRQNLVDRAMARVKQQISPKYYQVFDLYVVKEWPIMGDAVFRG